LKPKSRQQKNPLVLGILKKVWNQRIIGFHKRTGQKFVGFHERTDKGLAGNLKQVVVFFLPGLFQNFFLEKCSFIVYNTIWVFDSLGYQLWCSPLSAHEGLMPLSIPVSLWFSSHLCQPMRVWCHYQYPSHSGSHHWWWWWWVWSLVWSVEPQFIGEK
jgi:hypothetical protein